MKTIRIGEVVKQLNGKPQRFSEDGIERDMTVRDILIELYPALGGKNKGDSLSLSATMHKIYDCRDESIQLEDHDCAVIEAAIDASNARAWVQAELATVFSEAKRSLHI